MKVFDLTEKEQYGWNTELRRLNSLTKTSFVIYLDLIIWSMAYLYEVYYNLLLLNLNTLSGKYHRAMNVAERVELMNIFLKLWKEQWFIST